MNVILESIATYLQMPTEGYIGLAIAGAAAAIGTVLVTALIRRANRT